MKRFLLLIFFISLIGCSKNPHATESGSGNIEISITLPSTKSARSGDEIKSLRIWLVDKNGKIVRVITSDAGSPATGVDGITMTGVGTASAQFVNVERASYTLYFVANANSDVLSSYGKDATIDDAFKKATIDYEYGINGMPLSVVKEIHVVPGKNMISASLVRICAKIHVTVRNSTLDKMIWIKDISLNNISPDKSYLFEQDSFFPGAVYEELEKITTPIGIKPNAEMTYPDVYLFETDKAPGIKIRGGVFNGKQTEEPGVTTQTISSYSFEETSESLSTGNNQYLVMNKSMRYLLKGHPSGSVGIVFLASGDGPKNHLLASSDIEDYLWTYESQNVSWWTTYYDLKNIGQNKYLRNSSGKLNLGTSIDDFSFIGSETDGYTISSGSNYIWNNAGSLNFNANGKSPQNQWYFYQVTSVSTAEEVFAGAEALINYADDGLSHIDPDLGVAVPLQRIKRNESIDIRVNIFFNKNTGKLDFETETWKTVNNETTFD